jgi:antitoxin VapB
MTSRTAKIFTTGRSQAVRLPAEFRFEGSEVYVRRDPKTGDVILSRKPDSWDGLIALYDKEQVPDDFLGPSDRDQAVHDRDPFEGWSE